MKQAFLFIYQPSVHVSILIFPHELAVEVYFLFFASVFKHGEGMAEIKGICDRISSCWSPGSDRRRSTRQMLRSGRWPYRDADNPSPWLPSPLQRKNIIYGVSEKTIRNLSNDGPYYLLNAVTTKIHKYNNINLLHQN